MTQANNAPTPDQREQARNEPTALQRAVAALEKMKTRLDAFERAASEPIAVVGVGCRFPGKGEGPVAFWETLDEGIDAIREIPSTRFKLADERSEARWAALLDDVSTFDAGFFGISPREAETLDPQQRMLLEVTWEALENAGQPANLLFGSRTGVFVGICSADYQARVDQARSGRYDAYCATGNAFNTAAGRISFAMGFQGPAISIDTACSSSLVAITLACQSLRAGDTNVALAGGVNAILAPRMMALLLEMQALSPDGRCKTLDARANGFVRGEGCGIVVLKRLSDALRDDDHIYGIIRGWAVNQDGRSTGLTTPNVLAQQAMLRQALERARLSPEDIGYIEMHGTGTPLGDPIEAEALHEVFGSPRQDGSSCMLGALKTNVGHLEGAAGVAGFIKVLLALEHERIPKNLHFKRLNPRISFDGTPFVIPTESISWPRGKKPRCAGVSSFGVSGTNAHIILEEAPLARTTVHRTQASAYLLPLSAKTPQALAALSRSYADWFAGATASPIQDVAYTASMRRGHLEHRLAVVARTREEFAEALATFAKQGTSMGVVSGYTPSQSAPRVVFVFPGQGSQWIGAGRQLLEQEQVFYDTLRACSEAIHSEAGFSVFEKIAAVEAHATIAEIDVMQPMLFAFEVALAALWRSWGVEPSAVVGHSMGEIAAAFVAGALSLRDAAAVVCRRSRLLRRVSGQGAMALAELTPENAERMLRGYDDRLSIAVSNGPRTTVIAGDPAALEEVMGKLEREGVFCQRIKADVASHSPQMDVLLDDLRAALSDVSAADVQIPMRSTVTGQYVRDADLSNAYWVDNLRKPVLFSHAIEQLIADGYTIFVEVSPHPILLPFIDENLQTKNIDGAVVSSLRHGRDELQCLLSSLGALYVRGVPVAWKRFFPNGGRVVPLPTYRWQRERYWVEEPIVQPVATHVDDAYLDSYFYSIEWRQVNPYPQASEADISNGIWLVFMDEAGTGESLVARMQAHGQTCISVRAGTQLVRTARHSYTLNVRAPEEFSALLCDALGGERCAGIVYLFSADNRSMDPTDEASVLDAQHFGFLGLLYLLQAVLGTASERPPLWAVTRGVISAAGEAITNPAHAPVWGLGRTVDLEQPDLRCTRIDLDASVSASDGEALSREIALHDNEQQVAIRQGRRYAARIVRAPIEKTPSKPAFSADATYLVTGGLSGLGLSIAAWMVRAGARNLVLVGRKSPSESTSATIGQLEALGGVRIVVHQADVSLRADIAGVFAKIAEQMPPLRGIVHAAGVAEGPLPILNTRRETFERMIASKVKGTCNIYAFSRQSKLDFFILYSSASATLGLVGQASYAGANAFMDAIAVWSAKRYPACMSIQWGAFSATGMARDDDTRKRVAGAGMGSMTPDDGLMAISRLMAHPRPNVAVMAFSIVHMQRMFPHVVHSRYFSELRHAQDTASMAVVANALPDADIQQELASAPRDQKYEVLEAHMLRRIGEILRLNPSRIDRDAPFSSLGMDSLMSLELRNRLQRDFNLTLPATLLFAHPAPKALIAHVFERLGFSEGTPPSKLIRTEPQRTANVLDSRQASVSHGVAQPRPVDTRKQPPIPPVADEMEARLAAKLAALDKYLDDD